MIIAVMSLESRIQKALITFVACRLIDRNTTSDERLTSLQSPASLVLRREDNNLAADDVNCRPQPIDRTSRPPLTESFRPGRHTYEDIQYIQMYKIRSRNEESPDYANLSKVDALDMGFFRGNHKSSTPSELLL